MKVLFLFAIFGGKKKNLFKVNGKRNNSKTQ